MKIFSNLILLFGILCFHPVVGQDIPNAGLENWVLMGNFENPEFWNTANQTVMGVSLVSTKKSTQSHSGNYAAQLETIGFLTFKIPGLITLGNFTVNIWTQQFSITGGIPFNKRPTRLNFYYTYQPAPGDKMQVAVWLLRNASATVPDTIGKAMFVSAQTQNIYSLISLEIEYLSPLNPETLNIVAVSSNPYNPVVGSVLRIDDLSLEFSTTYIQPLHFAEHLYPVPAEKYIFLPHSPEGSQVQIMNLQNQIMYINKLFTTDPLDISFLAPGFYQVIFIPLSGERPKLFKLIKH